MKPQSSLPSEKEQAHRRMSLLQKPFPVTEEKDRPMPHQFIPALITGMKQKTNGLYFSRTAPPVIFGRYLWSALWLEKATDPFGNPSASAATWQQHGKLPGYTRHTQQHANISVCGRISGVSKWRDEQGWSWKCLLARRSGYHWCTPFNYTAPTSSICQAFNQRPDGIPCFYMTAVACSGSSPKDAIT